ncbi:MAG: preprotein translocase subunit SecG [Alphaproteobacteria bacterium]|nr:preprotein translocase subunit SecG [Alphaproteobacteria bacterium]MDX5370152.1 preprotein translocase subunit SecG [Alphaproteobacteria bacterium]MDX5464709.1 preprotein translocase subunit SecG [Alphaproteobacteria bacterium]
MYQILLIIHLVVTVFLIGVVLLQKSEGGALGIGGGGGGMMSARGAGNVLTRTTAVLAAIFMALSLALTWLAGNTGSSSILDTAPITTPLTSEQLRGEASGTTSTQDTPAAPSGPTVPATD